MTVIDHFAVACPDLDEAIAWFADLTGVTPSAGGSHPGVGTRNALVSLGARTYIELIAPDPYQPEPPAPRPFSIDECDTPTLTAFAVAPDDIDTAVARIRAEAGFDLGEVSAMSRRRPDGVDLHWRLTRHIAPAGGAVVPFLIDWGDSPHPAASAAAGCTMASAAVWTPDAANVATALAIVDLHIPVEEATEPAIQLGLETPQGSVTLGRRDNDE